jgi:hypothetical protein
MLLEREELFARLEELGSEGGRLVFVGGEAGSARRRSSVRSRPVDRPSAALART